MYQRRRARVLLSLLVLLTLTLITIDFRAGHDGPLSALRRVATAAFSPVQDGVASVLRPIGELFGGIGDAFSARNENELLRQRLDELESAQQNVTDLLRENAELRRLVGMQERLAEASVPARVIALSPSNFEWTVTLDVGARAGVRRDMVVINGDGLVGRVIQVTEDASRVLLAIDPNFSAASRDARLGETGLITGQGGDLMRYRPLDPEAELEVGDQIITSGYDNGIFPPGIPIGTVEEVGATSALLDRYLRVRPFVDFSRLDVVVVVLRAAIVAPPDELDTIRAPFEPPAVLQPQDPAPDEARFAPQPADDE